MTDIATRPNLITPGGRWRNWGRSQETTPEFVSKAASTSDVVDTVAFARDRNLTIKPIGAGHSFSGIAATEGVQLDISAMDGVVNTDGNLVTLGAGTNLYQLPALLGAHGLALENMGDIDRQTVAGAISTGTHGTGASFGGIATQVEAMTIVTASGEVMKVSKDENPELLPAARVGLGALGVVTDVTLRCVPDFVMHAVEVKEPLDSVLDDWSARASGVDHFEFYWFPHTGSAMTKSNSRMPADTPRVLQNKFGAWVDEELMANGIYVAMCQLGRLAPGLTPPLNRLAESAYASRDVTDGWHQVFTSPRRVRFREMEYSIPVEAIPDAVRAVRKLIDDRKWKVTFPLEVRVAAADENWLSTAYGRQAGYVAVHRYYREDPTEYFTAVEHIMRSFDGRPHWGKMNYRTADDLRPAYPKFDDFVAVRNRLDPDRVFANDYLTRVLGS